MNLLIFLVFSYSMHVFFSRAMALRVQYCTEFLVIVGNYYHQILYAYNVIYTFFGLYIYIFKVIKEIYEINGKCGDS